MKKDMDICMQKPAKLFILSKELQQAYENENYKLQNYKNYK